MTALNPPHRAAVSSSTSWFLDIERVAIHHSPTAVAVPMPVEDQLGHAGLGNDLRHGDLRAVQLDGADGGVEEFLSTRGSPCLAIPRGVALRASSLPRLRGCHFGYHE